MKGARSPPRPRPLDWSGMDWLALGRKIAGKGAPILGSVIGSVVPGTKPIIDALASAFSAASSEPDTIALALDKDPAVAVKLRELEIQYALELVRLTQTDSAQFLADRQDARRRETEQVRVTGRRDWFVPALASVMVVGGFALAGLILFHAVPTENTETANIILGMLFGGVVSVIGYYFGSSKSSNDKTGLLARKDRT